MLLLAENASIFLGVGVIVNTDAAADDDGMTPPYFFLESIFISTSISGLGGNHRKELLVWLERLLTC